MNLSEKFGTPHISAPRYSLVTSGVSNGSYFFIFVLLISLTGCLDSKTAFVDSSKPIVGKISDASLLRACRQSNFPEVHESYLRELEKRGLRDRCYDNPSVKKEVDAEFEKRAKRTAELKAKLAARA